jgi:hypothetical protein
MASAGPTARERNALLHGKLVKVILLSDLGGQFFIHSLYDSANSSLDDINPVRPEDIDWDEWDRISPDDVGEDAEDNLTDRFSGMSLSSASLSSPWASLPVDPLVAAEEQALRLGPFPGVTGSSSRRAAYVVYFGRKMGVFITW